MSVALLMVIALVLGFLAARSFPHASAATPAPTDSSSSSTLAGQLAQHLVVVDKNGTFKSFDASGLKGVKYFAFYHSASWCPPCKILTPQLVKFYNSFKPQHPDFELIFISHDDDAPSQLDHMKADAMPWPAVRYDDIDNLKLKDMDPNAGLPDLLLEDANGKVISDTFPPLGSGDTNKVLDDIKRIVH